MREERAAVATDDTLVTGPLSVNVDALWLVQALLGVERLAPELRTRPYGAARNDEWVGEHPGLQSLREAGVVDANGEVIPDLASRLAILNAPDVEVVILVARGQVAWGAERLGDPTTWRTIPEDQLRVVLARRDGKWVSAARAGDGMAGRCGLGADGQRLPLRTVQDSARQCARRPTHLRCRAGRLGHLDHAARSRPARTSAGRT